MAACRAETSIRLNCRSPRSVGKNAFGESSSTPSDRVDARIAVEYNYLCHVAWRPLKGEWELNITVRLFAGLREGLGGERLFLDLPDGATVGDVLEQVRQRSEKTATMVSKSAVVIDLEYVFAEKVLSDGTELSLLPPVSGG